MSPLLISMGIFAAYMVGGTILVGLALILGARLAKVPEFTPGRGFVGGFTVSMVSWFVFVLVLKLADKPEQPLINTGFYVALLAAVGISYIITMKFADVEPGAVPKIWAPAAVGLAVMLFLARTKGNEFKESQGFYRGFENIAHLNMLDPPDAMSTPEKAVNYYNQQFTALKNANQDSGIGKLMATVTQEDVKWFNESYEYMASQDFAMSITGIDKVVTDPNAKKGIGLITLAKPIYGKIETAREDGDSAVVKMSSGQVVRLKREGKNWKVVNWLGNRAHMVHNMYEVKKNQGATLTPEDERAKDGPDPLYEQETKELCQKLGVPYEEYNPHYDPELMGVGGNALANADPNKPQQPADPLSQAQPGELIDQSGDPAAAASAPPPPQGALPPEGASTEEKMAALNANMDAQVAMLEAAAGRAPRATPGPVILTNVPTDTLWTQYFESVRRIQANDPTGVFEFMKCLSSDDRAWLEQNYMAIADMLTPGQPYATPEQAKLVVLQAMLRNMPVDASAKVTCNTRHGLGVAKFVQNGASGRAEYKTAITQEGGRWVLAHMFFTRDFVWLPQLALYKQARGIPVSAEEQVFLASGYANFQQQVRMVYQQVGFEG